MIMNGAPRRSHTVGQKINLLLRGKWLFGLAIAALLSVAATAPTISQQNLDEQYIQIMNLIDRGDALRESGKTDAAKAKYKQAEVLLLNFKRANPQWNSKTVNYRLNEVAERLETRSQIPSPSAPTPSKAAVNPEASSKASSKSSIKLLDPGSEPRKILRLHVKSGDKQTVIMTIKMSMEMPGMAAGGAPMNIPAMSLPADVTVQSVAPNGDISYEMVFGEAGVVEEPGAAPKMIETMKTQLAGLKGLTVNAVISDRGISKKVDVKASPNADPKMRQMTDQIKDGMSNASQPFPEEAVGPGAKWELKMPVKSQGMTLNQTADYQLVSVDGDHVSTTSTLTQSAANQKIQNPAMGSVQMNLIQMTNNATGSAAADLSKLMPLQATMDTHMEMNSEVTVGNKTQPLAMKMAMNVTMEAR